MTSSVNRLVKTFPGKGGILTRVDSLSRISRKYSKSEYRLRTEEYLTRNAGMFVWQRGTTRVSYTILRPCQCYSPLSQFHNRYTSSCQILGKGRQSKQSSIGIASLAMIYSPCVIAFRTSTSRKFSGTPYISSTDSLRVLRLSTLANGL